MRIACLVSALMLTGWIGGNGGGACRGTACAEEGAARPALALPLGASGAGSYAWLHGRTAAPGAQAAFFAGSRASPWLSGAKGMLGESLTARAVEREVFAGLRGWAPLSPARVGASGIDHLYFKTDAVGRIRDALVVETKAYGSLPGTARYGPQMSLSWQRKWLADTAADYRRLAGRLVAAADSPVARQPFSRAPADALKLALPDNRRAVVWFENGQYRYASDGGFLNRRDLAQIAGGTEAHLRRMAAGNGTGWRSRYFQYGVEDGRHVFRFSPVDLGSGKPLAGASVQTVKGAFHELPREYRGMLRQSFREMIQGQPRFRGVASVDAMVERACRNPDYVRTLQPAPRLGWGTMGRSMALGGAVGGSVVALLDVGAQYAMQGHVDWSQTGRMFATGATAGAVGMGTSTGTLFLLTQTASAAQLQSAGATGTLLRVGAGRLAPAFSAAAGGLGASAVFAYGPYLMGWTDLSTAHATMAQGTAVSAGGFLMMGGALWAAQTLGTAGTGVAITTLSGAAATNAGLAALGGGTVAAGGGGMALGAKVLVVSRVAGAVIIVGTAAYGGYRTLKSQDSQRLLIDKEVDWFTRAVEVDATHLNLPVVR